MNSTTKINETCLKSNDTILKLLDTSLKLKSTFGQGHFFGDELELLFEWKWMKNVWKTLVKPIYVTIWHVIIALYNEHSAFLHNWYCSHQTMQLCGWQQLISTSCNIQTHRTSHKNWERGDSLLARLPNFQMNHGDSGILNLTYMLDATNWIHNL